MTPHIEPKGTLPVSGGLICLIEKMFFNKHNSVEHHTGLIGGVAQLFHLITV